MKRKFALLAVLYGCAPALGEEPKAFDAAAAFGARPSVSGMTLSPDGQSVAYRSPIQGQGSALHTLSLAQGARPKPALALSGKPERLGHCSWVANDRLACTIYGSVKDPIYGVVPFSRLMAVNADGANLRMLSKRDSFYGHGVQLRGGEIIDSLPAEDGAVLMTRTYIPDDRIGSHLGSSAEGLGVDRLDTRTLAVKRVEAPRSDAVEYISDGRGAVRIIGLSRKIGTTSGEQDAGIR